MTTQSALLPILCIALLSACGKQEPATASNTPEPAAAPVTSATAAPAVVDSATARGESTYKKTCFLCHGTGAGGAPMLGDATEWAPRIANGNELLYQHAIAGFTGDKGVMPPKGGNVALSDDEVKATVDYMLSQVK